MPARAAKFVSAIFAGVLAGIPLATISHGAAPAADDCLSAPKDQAGHGGHWYYRIDHATNRHCWYLRDAKLSQSDTANAAPPAKPASSNVDAATQRSIADAHAELPAQTAIDQPKRDDGLAPAQRLDESGAQRIARRLSRDQCHPQSMRHQVPIEPDCASLSGGIRRTAVIRPRTRPTGRGARVPPGASDPIDTARDTRGGCCGSAPR